MLSFLSQPALSMQGVDLLENEAERIRGEIEIRLEAPDVVNRDSMILGILQICGIWLVAVCCTG
jgi:hypothetical protein